VSGPSRPSRRHIWALLVLIWGLLGLCAVVAALVFDAPEVAVTMLIGGVAGSLGALLAGRFFVRARSRKLTARHKAEVGLRVVDGHQPGLGPRWRHGVGTLVPGRLDFRGTVGGVRFLRRAPITIDVKQIDRDIPRTTGLREALSVMPGTEVVQLITPTARLEWAVPGPQIDWAIEKLLPSRDAAGGS
jgi:uncharacterized MnhB-related membrane protein